MRVFAIAVMTQLGITFAAFAAVLVTMPGPAVAASAHRPPPPSQVVDGLYKSVVYSLPGNVTLVCILTRLPESFPTFTVPPEYSCVVPPKVAHP